MPDLLTHTAAAYLAARRWFPRAGAILFILGTMLPDMLSRPFHILFPALHWWVMPLHTPAGMAIVCWIITGFFRTGERGGVFIALSGGVLLHFFLDLPQKHLVAGYFWLFPFSWTTYEWGWWWSEESVQIVPLMILLVAFVEILIYFHKRTARKQKAFPNGQDRTTNKNKYV
ncbi:MAG: hypothetical protein ONB44_11650 [candidate division KSB1 bacterium]|nr:hypothetical protein [candidate division KSB1 bacterium]MDZ7302779.1 hypothetical protein [candidate division KSB1 bacterium]MDZ7310056.1 hypothetical protein [candidate division KSB1 bacterium]